MNIIQTVYISILKYTYAVTKRINEKIRNAVIWLFSFILIWLCIYNYAVWSRGVSTTQFDRDILGCLCLAVIGLFSVNGELKQVKWNRQIVFIWYVLGSLLFLSGLLHSVENSYWLWSYTMLIGFPGFYLIWQNRKDYSTLFDIISSAMLVILLIFFVICLCTINSEVNISGRYWAFMRNPNHLGKVAASGMIAVLYLYLRLRDRYRWIMAVPGGICVTLAVLSGSRTAIIVIAAQLIVFMAGNIKCCLKEKSYIRTAAGLIAFVLLGVLSMVAAEKGLEYCQLLHDRAGIVQDSTQDTGENISASESAEDTEAANTTDTEENISSSEESIRQNSDALTSRFELDGKTVDQISSGRITVWKYFIDHLNLFGNDWVQYSAAAPEYKHQWAHNDVLEVAYRSGVIAGLFDLLLLAYLGIYVLRVMFSGRMSEKYHYFTASAILTYGGFAMLDVISFPFSMQYTFMCFVALMPIFERRYELWTARKSR